MNSFVKPKPRLPGGRCLPATLCRAAHGHGQPITALAPMQDVTSLPFMEVIAHCGAPDYFFTEYFRVHACSRLDPEILRSVMENKTDRPVFAQLIGESLPHLERTARELQNYPVAGIDLNLGCPAPKVYRKNVGGGLLRDPGRVDKILGHLRPLIKGLFTVKMRIGFACDEHFEALLELINRHSIDLLSLHGRTVKEMYRGEPHYDHIAQAVQIVRCPVLANGNITSPAKAMQVAAYTGAAGIMIGRSAIRNPWIFRQIREAHSPDGRIFQPTLADVRDYVEALYEAFRKPDVPELRQVNRLKKFLNFVGQGVDPEGKFLHQMRRTQTHRELMETCHRHMIENGKAEQPFPLEPHQGVNARPNRESPPARNTAISLTADFADNLLNNARKALSLSA